MKAYAIRALRIVGFVVGILLATVFFVLACEALQMGPLLSAGPVAKPAIQAGFTLLLACGTTLYGLFRYYLD